MNVCLQGNGLLKIDPGYREFVNKNNNKPKNKEEFTLEKNYIENIFNISDSTARTKTPPINNKITENNVRISHFITHKIGIEQRISRHFKKSFDKTQANKSSFDENTGNETIETSKLTAIQTPTESKETNVTLNSLTNPNIQQDSILKVKK